MDSLWIDADMGKPDQLPSQIWETKLGFLRQVREVLAGSLFLFREPSWRNGDRFHRSPLASKYRLQGL